MLIRTRFFICASLCLPAGLAMAQEVRPHTATLSPADVREAMNRAARFFGEQVAVEGGYVWEYSKDSKERWGEQAAGSRQIWVQPPGTPSVGLAFVRAWKRTGEKYCLKAARRAAHALAWGQLSSGGWNYSVDFDPDRARQSHYRRDVEAGSADPANRKYTSTFDDDTSQSALRLLMEFDRATNFADETVHRSARYALEQYLKVQRPNGGWPQRFEGPCRLADWPVRSARYPERWPREYPGEKYQYFYTLNDDVAHDLILTMLLAHEIYGDQVCLESACRTGDFFIAAQLPEPQPAWAQQYNADMEPAWARKFEPPSVVSRESVSVIRSLGELYLRTGDEKYLRPIPPFLNWLERSRLADGQFARFYELRTNRPLYFTRDYKLVYTDDDVPTHYAFKQTFDLPALRRWYDDLPRRRQLEDGPESTPLTTRRPSDERVSRVIRDLDSQGRWLDSDGKITSTTFIRNLDMVSAWLERDRSD